MNSVWIRVFGHIPGSDSHHRRFLAVFSVGFVGFFTVSTIAAPETETDRPIEDYAEIYVDRYIEPDESLILQEEGEQKSEALAAYVVGLSKMKTGDHAGAIEAFERVLKVRPDAIGLAEKLAYLIARDGRPVDGKLMLEQSLEANPDQVGAHVALSDYLLTYFPEEDETAVRAFELAEAAVEKFADNPIAYGHLVKLCIVIGRRDVAKSVMNRGLAREDSNPYYWLAMANISKRLWPLRKAARQEPVLLNKIYQKALDHAEERVPVLVQVATFYHASRQADKARDLYEKVLVLASDRLDVRERLAKIYGALGEVDQMIATLKEIVEIDPQNVQTHKVLADLYQQREETDQSIYHRRQALKISKGDVSEYRGLAQLLLQEARFDEAVSVLQRAAYLYPEEIEIPWILAGIAMERKQWKDVLRHNEQFIELANAVAPGALDKEFYFRYAIAAERSGDIDRATMLLQKSIDLLDGEDLEDPPTRSFAATVYNYLGYTWVENDLNLDQGGELIKASLELEPDSGATMDSLGWYHFKKENWSLALKTLLKAEKMIEEADGVIFDHIGQAWFEVGNREQAVAYLERAVALEPDKTEFTERLEQFRTAEVPRTLPVELPESAPEPSDAPTLDEDAIEENLPADLQRNAA